MLANAGLALPPVAVGIFVLILLLPRGAFGSLRIEFTLYAVYHRAGDPGAPVHRRPDRGRRAWRSRPGCSTRRARSARAGGSSRCSPMREARIGVLAAVIAAMGATVSEVGAVVIVGGNFQGEDETLASALLAKFTFCPNDPRETAIALMLGGPGPRAARQPDGDPAAGDAQPRFRAARA